MAGFTGADARALDLANLGSAGPVEMHHAFAADGEVSGRDAAVARSRRWVRCGSDRAAERAHGPTVSFPRREPMCNTMNPLPPKS